MNTPAAGQMNAAGALLAMVTAFRSLPAPALRLQELPSGESGRGFVWGVNVSLHDSLDHFEQWRAALGLDPDTVTAYLEDDTVNWLAALGTWSGVPVRLTGFFHFHTPEQDP